LDWARVIFEYLEQALQRAIHKAMQLHTWSLDWQRVNSVISII
jgi:hypothetical protein